MRRTFGLILILFACCGHLAAQENDTLPDFKRHEIGISTGAFSQPSFFFILSEAYPIYYEGYKIENSNFCMYNIGTFSMSYRYHFTKYQSLGIVSTLLFSKIVDNNMDRNCSGFFTYWSLEPQYRITYKRFEHCSLYISWALGITVRIASNEHVAYWDDSSSDWFTMNYGNLYVAPSTHITLLGVSLGKDNRANFELGFGTQGLFNVGYSRRF